MISAPGLKPSDWLMSVGSIATPDLLRGIASFDRLTRSPVAVESSFSVK